MRHLLAVGAVLLFAAPAQAATQSLTTSRAVQRDCTARLLPAGTAGVAGTRFTAPAEGTIRARLRGSGDWDLAAFDSAGTLIVGSAAFRANEVLDVDLRKGARITLQACRVAGGASDAALQTTFTRVDFEKFAQQGPTMLVEVPFTEAWQLAALERLGLDVTHDIHDGRARVMLHGNANRDTLLRTGFGYTVVHADVAAVERQWRARDRRLAQEGQSQLPSGRQEYRTYDDVQAELKDWISRYDGLVRGFTLKTKTFEGRDIQAVEIARDVHSSDDGRPVLFLNGIHHAREWPATEVLMEFALDLLKNNSQDPRLARILRDVRVVLQPYTNIDGFLVSRNAVAPDPASPANVPYSTATGVVVMGGSQGYKRKNCNPYPSAYTGQPCEASVGTDNNRNYPHQWGGNGASTNPNDQSYRGQGPGSEPETKAVQELHLSLNAPVLMSMHNIAAKVLRPPGTEAEGKAPDEEFLAALGERMATPTGYANEYGWQLYDVTGGTKDWAYAATGSAGYTIETGPANGDFHGPYQEVVIDQYVGTDGLGGMRAALMAAAEAAIDKQWTGRITGNAPPGRTLRLTKTIATLTSPVCAVAEPLPVGVGGNGEDPTSCNGAGEVMEIPEKLDITTQVPASGRFEWWLNPSTRPYAKAPEAYTLTCEDGGKVLSSQDVIVNRGQVVKLDLPCGGKLTPKLRVGKIKVAGRKVRVPLTATGATAKRVVVTVLKGRKAVGRAKLASLSGRKTVTVKLKRPLAKGRYSVRVTAKGAKAASKKLTVRR